MSDIDISDVRIRASLSEAGKWSGRLAILQYVFAALLGLGSVFLLVSVLALGTSVDELGLGVGLAGVMIPFVLLMLGSTAFYVFLARKLQGFANAFTVSAGQVLTNERLERGFQDFGTLFKVSILAVVIFFVLGMVLSFLLVAMLPAFGGAAPG